MNETVWTKDCHGNVSKKNQKMEGWEPEDGFSIFLKAFQNLKEVARKSDLLECDGSPFDARGTPTAKYIGCSEEGC